MEVGEEGDYNIYLSLRGCLHRNDLCIKMGSDRAILMFHNCEGQSHKTVSTDHNFCRERRVEADSNRGPSAYQPNALPLGQTGSRIIIIIAVIFLAPYLTNKARCAHPRR